MTRIGLLSLFRCIFDYSNCQAGFVQIEPCLKKKKSLLTGKEKLDVAKTVDEGFREFHGTLTPTRGESQAAKSHRASIEACLKNNFEINRFFRTGSFGNGTSIRGYSDVDYFACIPPKNLKQSSVTTLQDVRKALICRFPKSDIIIRTPTVRVRFGTDASESTEIVPAKFIKIDKGGKYIYEIPDSSGGWMRSSPDTHNNYVDEVDRELDGKVKSLVRLLKAWKYYCGVPVSSFYLEMRVAKYASREDFIDYCWDLGNIFRSLWDNQLAALKDPKGISGHISPCSSEAQRSDALSKLKTALGRAEKARQAEKAGKISKAFYWWNLLFAGKFPSYI